MSQSVIGALRANLGMDSAQFERGARRAQGASDDLRGRLGRITAVAAAVSAALTAMVASAASVANETSRLASVANATPEQLQRMASATNTVGINQERLADILKDVNERIGDFLSTGGGEMADFFENIAPQVGVTADMFRNLSGPEALQLYVNTLERAGLSQQQMTFYMEALASDATLLLPLLRSNGEELERLGQASDRFGLRLSNGQVAALNETNVALGRVRDVMIGLRDQIGARLAPVITTVTEAFVTSAQEGGALSTVIQLLLDNVEALAAGMAAVSALLVGQVVVNIVRATGVVNTLAAAVGLLRSAFILMTGPVGIAVGLVGAALVVLDRFKTLNENLPPSIDDVREAQDLLNVALGGYAAGARGSGAEAIAYAQNLETTARAALAATEAQLAFNAARFAGVDREAMEVLAQQPGAETNPQLGAYREMLRQEEQAEELRTSLENARRTLNSLRIEAATAGESIVELVFDTTDLDNATTEVVETVTTATDALSRLGGGAGRAADDIDEMADSLSEAESASDRLSGMFSSTMSGIIRNSGSAREAVSRLLDSLADMALQAAFQPVFSNLFGGSSLISSIFGGFRAEGGPVATGRAYVVGEEGPEWFVPGASGAIVPNDAMGSAPITVSMPISIDARGAERGAGDDIARSLRTQMPELQRMVIETVAEAQKRGRL
ncbi:phage tail tape measure protein [Roseicyclus marinus]|uniref:hypothetical protein n=1 Tax=Roseicyclus marinus TaxID=2161673 RepID=UPI00240ED1D2|nr:hypothetical protein [Roseicyclus marinus]MDG3040435.1 hypothetical protein [Roseicyclus marinus]